MATRLWHGDFLVQRDILLPDYLENTGGVVDIDDVRLCRDFHPIAGEVHESEGYACGAVSALYIAKLRIRGLEIDFWHYGLHCRYGGS